MTYFSSSQKIKNIVNLVDNSFTSVQVSTSVITFPGTLTDYTPSSGSVSVVFECSTQFAWNPDSLRSYGDFSLQYSTNSGLTWQDFQNCQLFEGHNSSDYVDNFWWTDHWTFVVDSWSGQRRLRIATRSYNTGSEFTIGRSYNTYPSNGEGVGSMTQVSIYSVM